MSIINGELSLALQKPSKHFNQRPIEQPISLLVIHNISLPEGNFKGSCVEDLFCDSLNYGYHPSFTDLKGLKVSAHLFIRRNAQVIQFVNFNSRAWHAGRQLACRRAAKTVSGPTIAGAGGDLAIYGDAYGSIDRWRADARCRD